MEIHDLCQRHLQQMTLEAFKAIAMNETNLKKTDLSNSSGVSESLNTGQTIIYVSRNLRLWCYSTSSTGKREFTRPSLNTNMRQYELS